MSTALDALVNEIATAVAAKLKAERADEQKRLFSVKDAATYLGRTGASVRGLIAEGTIPQECVRRIGGRVFLDKQKLDAWISAQ